MTRRSRHLGRFALVPCRACAVVLVTLISALAFERSARAEAACFSAPWHHLGDTGAELVRPLPLAFAGGAIVAPVAMAPTGLDHELRLVAQEDLGGHHNLEPVSVVAPYVLGGGVLAGFLVSAGLGACGAERPQAAMLQAMVLSLGSTVLLKFAVGREWPNAGLDPEDPDRLDHPEYAEHFTPFQSFGSWPSGHTSFMFAAAASFRTSTPGLGVASWVGYPLALGVAAGMWLGDHHWASDIVSGALLGEALGSSVGYGFANESRERVSFGAAPVMPAYGATLARGAVIYGYGVW